MEELQHLASLALHALPKSVQVVGRPRQPCTVYSDAGFGPGKPIICGWCIYHPWWSNVIGQSIQLDTDTTARWVAHTTEIFPAEACCVVLVPFNHPEAFRDMDVLWFIDNEAAASSAIRGASGSPDVDRIVQIAHMMFLKL